MAHNAAYLNAKIILVIHELYSQLNQEELLLWGFPAMLALEVILQQILLRMP